MERLGPHAQRRLLARVPEVTALFWLTKILTTAMGEALSDFLVFDINRYLAVVVGALALVLALGLQFSTRRYVAWVYWLAVAMVAVFGTMAADAAHIVLGIPYAGSSLAFALILAVIFVLWGRAEHTLSIHSIHTRRREMFYWATVLATFALGTATGDMTAVTVHLGYLASALLFAFLFAVPLLGRRLFAWNDVFTFWFAYVMTRPLGASIADSFGMSSKAGGLGVNRGLVSLVLALAIAALVAYLGATRLDVQREGSGSPASSRRAGAGARRRLRSAR